jgi:hypothetical protein
MNAPGGTRAGTGIWAWLCAGLMAAAGLWVLLRFGLTLWTAVLALVLLGCPAVMVWGMIEVRLRGTRHRGT